MKFTATQIAQLVQGEIIGDPQAEVSGIARIEDAQQGSMVFLSRENFLPLLEQTQANIVMINRDLVPQHSMTPTLIVVEDAYCAFQILLNMYQDLKPKPSGIEDFVKIHPSVALGEQVYVGSFSYIDQGAQIGEGTLIYPQCFIGKNVKIGKNCHLFSGVKIMDDCILGDGCVVHAGTVIGSDGFGFQKTDQGYTKIPQLGNVVLEDDVEIGANCTLDRATMGSTIIKKGTKLDNLIQIAHNVEIGSHNVIAAQTGIAGSAKLGDWNMVGGQVGIVGHISMGNGNKIQAQSGINRSVGDDQTFFGTPALEAGIFRRSYVHFKNLESIVKKINSLEKNK